MCVFLLNFQVISVSKMNEKKTFFFKIEHKKIQLKLNKNNNNKKCSICMFENEHGQQIDHFIFDLVSTVHGNQK